MRDDVIRAIASAKGVTNAFVLTHNIDFVFLQTVALAAFRMCGHPTITVFADAQCAAEAYASQAPVVDGLGVRYRVVPIAMSPGYRFHPKAVLLSGETDATLLVGSGNLTFGGWRENAEIWTRFDASGQGAGAFIEFRQYLDDVLRLALLGDAIAGELAEAFDTTTRQWLVDAQPSSSPSLLGRAGSGRSLLDAMATIGGEAAVDELLVCSPYFDAEGVALKALIDKFSPLRTAVLCQPAFSTLTRSAFAASATKATLEQVTFKHESVDETSRTAFVHAKFYGLRRGTEALVFAGSANCSRAALLATESEGNAELMTVRKLPTTELDSEIVGELHRVSDACVLAERQPEDGEITRLATLRVLAARLDASSLIVGFTPRRAAVHKCEVDGAVIPFAISQPGVLNAYCLSEPRTVRIQARVDDAEAWSTPAWIDLERHLRASARGRGLADSIRSRIQPGFWNAAAWADVMDVFCKHLSYMPTREGSRSSTTSNEKAASGKTFSYTDVFSTGYEAPMLGGLGALALKVDGGRERSLQQLLSQWLGIADGTSAGEPEASVDGTDDDTEQGDQPEVLPIRRPPPPPVTDADKRRIQKMLDQVEAAMTEPLFLSQRRPEQLAADLKVAAVLLRAGLREGWIDSSAFFRATHHVWIPFFFSGSPEAGLGWLEYRQHHAKGEAAFFEAFRSPELTAALLGWAFAVVPRDPTPAAARFHLAVALAVGRLPWLWDVGNDDAVAKELEVLLATTGMHGVTAETVRVAWARTLKRGHALVRLEKEVAALSPAALRSRIRATTLPAGALLWQGQAGYCVVTQTTPRIEGESVPVLRLQSQNESSKFSAPFAMPIEALLEETVIPLSPSFGLEPRQVLAEFLADIRGSLVATADAGPTIPKQQPARGRNGDPKRRN